MNESEYIQELKRKLPLLESEIFEKINEQQKQINFLFEERDKLKNQVQALENHIKN